jgi:hypothetical protein
MLNWYNVAIHTNVALRNVLNMLYTNPQIQLILKLLHNKCMLYICDTSEDVVRKRWSTFFSFFPLIRNKFEYGTSIDDLQKMHFVLNRHKHDRHEKFLMIIFSNYFSNDLLFAIYNACPSFPVINTGPVFEFVSD